MWVTVTSSMLNASQSKNVACCVDRAFLLTFSKYCFFLFNLIQFFCSAYAFSSASSKAFIVSFLLATLLATTTSSRERVLLYSSSTTLELAIARVERALYPLFRRKCDEAEQC